MFCQNSSFFHIVYFHYLGWNKHRLQSYHLPMSFKGPRLIPYYAVNWNIYHIPTSPSQAIHLENEDEQNQLLPNSKKKQKREKKNSSKYVSFRLRKLHLLEDFLGLKPSIGRQPPLEDDIHQKTTSIGRLPPMEDNLHWQTLWTYKTAISQRRLVLDPILKISNGRQNKSV